uniref:Reverse transcriptase domain-containing protein n=1 Tax=Photinus pyralis TaxID=7054 RepID=A0A1Y1LB48_PHOPY
MRAKNVNKETWSIVNSVTSHGASKNKNKIITLNIENSLITDDLQIANCFGDHFATAPVKAVRRRFNCTTSSCCTVGAQRVSSSFILFPIVKEDVMAEIRNLKNCSPGPDGIPVNVVKLLSTEVTDELVKIFNWSIKTGLFPSDFKCANIVPIPKGKDPSDKNNYRPISILNATSKVFERIVYRNLMQYLEKYNMLTSCQHGYRAGRSVETACYEFTQEIFKQNDDGNYVVGILFDFSKAFDTVNHTFLLQKLENFGIRGVALKWFESYIRDRKIVVTYNSATSRYFNLEMGVPQGSVLGPLLFLLYVNDLPKYIKNGHVIMYCDDISIVLASRCEEDLRSKIESVFEDMMWWCNKNNLILNVDKTEIISLSKKKVFDDASLSISNTKIVLSQTVRFLGTEIDNELKWAAHTDMVRKKLAKSYFALYQLKNLLSVKGLLNTYYGLVYPNVAYNIAIWGRTQNLKQLLIRQKRIIRLIFNLSFRATCKPIFIKHKILTVPCIFIYKILCLVKKYILNNTVNPKDINGYNTRRNQLPVPRHKKSSYESTTLYCGIKFYNKLDNATKQLPLKQFKTTVKNLLTSKAFYTTQEYLIDQ